MTVVSWRLWSLKRDFFFFAVTEDTTRPLGRKGGIQEANRGVMLNFYGLFVNSVGAMWQEGQWTWGPLRAEEGELKGAFKNRTRNNGGCLGWTDGISRVSSPFFFGCVPKTSPGGLKGGHCPVGAKTTMDRGLQWLRVMAHPQHPWPQSHRDTGPTSLFSIYHIHKITFSLNSLKKIVYWQSPKGSVFVTFKYLIMQKKVGPSL